MDKSQLYEEIAKRKSIPQHDLPYNGGNGRIDRCVDLMRQGKIRTGGTLLDVGGSIGDMGYAVRDLFSKRIVNDIAELPLESAKKKGNEVLRSDIDRGGFLGIAAKEIDVVTALDFIEHIIDPENFARECFRVLKPGGEVFINTPNIQYWFHIKQLIHGTFPHTSGDKEVWHGGHLAFFTFRDLCDIFGTAGFTNFQQFKDEECYNALAINDAERNGFMKPKTQAEYTDLCMRFGNPNLLFKAVKP